MTKRSALVATLFVALLALRAGSVWGNPLHDHGPGTTPGHNPARLSAGSIDWPSIAQVIEVVSLRNYNTRLVVLSTMLLGIASGLVGTFLLLRKRSLMGDALSHACLPGIALAFMAMISLGGTGKALAGLLAGATVTGVTGVLVVLLIRSTTRVKDDAAMGIVLSVFFGIGIAILGMVQSMPNASAAGLESFIYGKAASVIKQDFILITSVALAIAVLSVLLLKEFTLLCFDEGYGKALGWPVNRLDIIMLALVAAITVVGLQSVGLILIIAFLITPAAAARFWTANLRRMLLLSGVIGGVSGWLGSSMSALAPRLPAGAVIVLVAAGIFVVSMILGTERGVLLRYIRHSQLQRTIGHQNFLRAAYELLEADSQNRPRGLVANVSLSLDRIVVKRTWNTRTVKRLLRQAAREDDIESAAGRHLLLSESGFGEAARLTRNHRLWEMYLLTHADIAPQHVDRDADVVEHVLGPAMVRELENEMIRRRWRYPMPPNPHSSGNERKAKVV